MRLAVFLLWAVFVQALSCGKRPASELGGLRSTEVRNGGDAVVCRDEAGRLLSAKLLDFYEARHLGLEINERPAGREPLQLTKNILSQIPEADSPRRRLLEQWVEVFLSEALFLEDVALVDVDDSNHIEVPRGCRLEQMAVHAEPTFPGQKRYTIDLELWNALGVRHKSGLILHEVLYRHAILYHGHEDSQHMRKWTAWLSSTSFQGASEAQYLEVLSQVGLTPTVSPEGLQILPGGRYNLAGNLVVGTLESPQEIFAYGLGECEFMGKVVFSLVTTGTPRSTTQVRSLTEGTTTGPCETYRCNWEPQGPDDESYKTTVSGKIRYDHLERCWVPEET